MPSTRRLDLRAEGEALRTGDLHDPITVSGRLYHYGLPCILRLDMGCEQVWCDEVIMPGVAEIHDGSYVWLGHTLSLHETWRYG